MSDEKKKELTPEEMNKVSGGILAEVALQDTAKGGCHDLEDLNSQAKLMIGKAEASGAIRNDLGKWIP